jgi:hypothetical protein
MPETRPRALPGPAHSPIAGLNVEPIRKPTESGRIAIPAASALRPSPAWSQIKVRKNAASVYSVVKAPSALSSPGDLKASMATSGSPPSRARRIS